MLRALAHVRVPEVDSSNVGQVLAALVQLLPRAASAEAPHAVASAAAAALAKHTALREAAYEQHNATLAALVSETAQSNITLSQMPASAGWRACRRNWAWCSRSFGSQHLRAALWQRGLRTR